MNETDEYGYTGLHMAAENGHLEVVNLLLVWHVCTEIRVLQLFRALDENRTFAGLLVRISGENGW